MSLTRQGSEYVILASGKPLMSSRMHGSEEHLAALGCREARTRAEPCVLVGGLGMGFTLRATLDLLPSAATVVVGELVPAVVDWNRGPLGPLANHPLKDPRVEVALGDVADTIRASRRRFDAMLLDVDNGPAAFTASHNTRLYDDGGLAAARAALTDGGVLAVWSAWEDRRVGERRQHAGVSPPGVGPAGEARGSERGPRPAGSAVRGERVPARLKKGGPRHTIFLGHL